MLELRHTAPLLTDGINSNYVGMGIALHSFQSRRNDLLCDTVVGSGRSQCIANRYGVGCSGAQLIVLTSVAIAIIGTLNWGLVGLFSFDLVAWIAGGATTLLARIIYVIVALAGLWCITLLFREEATGHSPHTA